jgi:hypothetical protein
MTTQAERRARLLALATEAVQAPTPKTAQEQALDLVARKLSLERFRAMFRSYTQAAAWVRDELGVDTSGLDDSASEANWEHIYQASLHIEAEQFTDPQSLAPPDRPRKTLQQTLEEREWEREVQRMQVEDQHFTANGGPQKFGQAY